MKDEIKTMINELASNFTKENRKEMMKYADQIDTSLIGKNEDDETTVLSINKDSLFVTTYQSNHWIRVDEYDEDGSIVGEMYDGKW